MVDFSNISKIASILVRRLELSRVDAEKAAANFDEYDLAKLVELDETAEATPWNRRAAAMTDAKKKMRDLIDTAKNRGSTAA